MENLIRLARWCRVADKLLAPLVRLAEIGFLIIAAFVVWGARGGLRAIEPTLAAYKGIATTVQPLVKPTSQNVNAILIQAGIATGEMAQASIEQRNYWKAVSEHTIDAIGDAQDAIKNWASVAGSIQEQVDPTFRRFQVTLDRTNVLLGSANDQVLNFGPLLSSTKSLVTHADSLVGDPATHDVLINFRAFTGNANAFVGDVQHVTHRFAYPPRQGVGSRLLGLFPLAVRTAQFGYYTGAWK